MIDIFICEDNKKHLNILRSCISNFILMEGFDMQIIQATPDPHTILKELTNAENTGLFFLDIDLKSDMNGLMLAQKIRQMIIPGLFEPPVRTLRATIPENESHIFR